MIWKWWEFKLTCGNWKEGAGGIAAKSIGGKSVNCCEFVSKFGGIGNCAKSFAGGNATGGCGNSAEGWGNEGGGGN